MLVADAEKYQRSQARRICQHMADVDPRSRQFLADELAVLLGADPGQHCAVQT